MTFRSGLGIIGLVAIFLMPPCSARADLVSWWKAEGNALDAVGSNDGTPHSGLQYATGVFGQAFSFDGIGTGINVPDNDNLKITGSMTIDAWLYVKGFPSVAQGWGMIIFRGDIRGGLDPYFLAVNQDGKIVFYISDASRNEVYLSTPPITTNQWLHVTATLDDATGLMRVYENGQVAAEYTTTIRPFRDLDPASYPGVGIGNHSSYPNNPVNYPFSGRIDELKVYNSVEAPPTVVLQNQSDNSIAMLSVSGTRFASSNTLTPTLPANWRVAAVADFDHDGWNDIVAQNTQTRAISILFVKSSRIVSSVPVNPTLPANWRVTAAADINGDGNPDIIVQNTATQQIAVLLMNGTTITQSRSFSKSLPTGWNIVGAADFNGDGQTDLVVQNASTRQISILTLNGLVVTGSIALNPTLPANWVVGAVGDYDGDGKPDLLVQNSVTGQISVLTIVNMKITSSYSLNPTAPAGWSLVGPK